MAIDDVARGIGGSAIARVNTGSTRIPAVDGVYDTFQRPNTSPGNIGLPNVGGAYSLRGESAIPASVGQIENNRFTSDEGDTCYAVQTLPANCNDLEFKGGWTSGSGSGESTLAALIGPANTNSALYANAALHFTCTRTSWNLQYVLATSFVTIATGTHSLSLDTDYRFRFSFDGNVVTYVVAGAKGRVREPALASAKLGPYATIECFYNGGTAKADKPYFSMFRAGYLPVGATNIRDRVVGYWRLENTNWTEASGQGLTLTGANSPTVASGKIGNGVSLAKASSQKLSRANTANLQLNGKDWTFTCWFYTTTAQLATSEYIFIASKGIDWALYIDCNANTVRIFGSPDGTYAGGLSRSATTTIVGETWYFAAVRFDATTGRMYISINGGAEDTLNVASINNSTADFEIGHATGWPGAFTGVYFEGLIDEPCLFATAPGHGGGLNSFERALVYNDGSGLAWPLA